MKNLNRLLYVLFTLSIIFCSGCPTINNLISPEKQCSLIKIGVKNGLRLAIGRFFANEKYSYTVQNVIKNQILPKLKGGDGAKQLTREDIDNMLELLNKNLENKHKIAIQSGIDLVLAWTPDFPKEKSSGIFGGILKNITCLFEAALEAFIESTPVITAAGKKQHGDIPLPEIKLKWVATKCIPCEKNKKNK